MVGRLLLEWRTHQAIEFENRNCQFTKEEIFEDNQMVYLLVPHSSAIANKYNKILARFHWPIIYRYHPWQDALQAERCHWSAIGL